MKEASQKTAHTYVYKVHSYSGKCRLIYSEQRLIIGCLETKVVEQRGMVGGNLKEALWLVETFWA